MSMAMKLGDAAGSTSCFSYEIFTLECDTSCRESVRGMACDSLETQVV
jgi:hypothetical protein